MKKLVDNDEDENDDDDEDDDSKIKKGLISRIKANILNKRHSHVLDDMGNTYGTVLTKTLFISSRTKR